MATSRVGGAGFNPNSYLSRVGSVGWEWEGESANYSMTGLFVLYFADNWIRSLKV